MLGFQALTFPRLIFSNELREVKALSVCKLEAWEVLGDRLYLKAGKVDAQVQRNARWERIPQSRPYSFRIQRCFGAAWPVSASARGAGGGTTGQTCGQGGCGHPSLWTWPWVRAAAGLPRQAVRMGLLTLAIGWQVTRERYRLCPGVRSFSILLPLGPGDRSNKTARATTKQMPEQQKRFVGETCMSYYSLGSGSERT